MDSIVQFTFRNKACLCNIYIDCALVPSYVFIILIDKELIIEFGEDITIKTNFKQCLAKRNDYDELTELKEAIFSAIKSLPEFMIAKEKAIHAPLSYTEEDNMYMQYCS